MVPMTRLRCIPHRPWRRCCLGDTWNAIVPHQSRCFFTAKFQLAPLCQNKVPTKIVFGSCSDPTEDLSYWNTIYKLRPDLVLMLGDNVYASDVVSLEQAYAIMAQHEGYQKVAQTVPIMATLDDNDYHDNQRKAKRTFLDFFQIPKTDPRWQPTRGVYTSQEFYMEQHEQELQIIMLDTRFAKNDFMPTSHWGAPTMERFVPDLDPTKTILGHEQWDWLQATLKHNQPKLRIIVSPIQVLANGHGWECWRMFPHERQRLLNLIKQHSETRTTTLFLSGDRHASAFYLNQDIYEVTCSSLTHSVPVGVLDQEVDATRLHEFVCENNFGLLEIDFDQNQIKASIRHALSNMELDCLELDF